MRALSVPGHGMRRCGAGAGMALAMVAAALCLASCATGPRAAHSPGAPPEGPGPGGDLVAGDQGPGPRRTTTLRFVVISDPHLYDAEAVGARGEAWKDALDGSGKNISATVAVLDQVVEDILALKPDFVLVPGDLSTDGEAANLEAVAARLARLEAAGIRVWVVPGNHDINNPHAATFEDGRRIPAATMDPGAFARTFGAFGFDEAYSRDRESLSWAARIAPDLVLLGMDSNDWSLDGPGPRPRTGGRFRPSTLAWMEDVLAEARDRGDQVLFMLHHGLVAHFRGHEAFIPQYLLSDWEAVGNTLARLGVGVVFTGHGHAQDVAMRRTPHGDLYDVETGSLASWPFPWRMAELDPEGRLALRHRATGTEWLADPGLRDLALHHEARVKRFIRAKAWSALGRFPLSAAERDYLADWGTALLMGHFAGNEGLGGDGEVLRLDGARLGWLAGLGLGLFAPTLESLALDPAPLDHDIDLFLEAGRAD